MTEYRGYNIDGDGTFGMKVIKPTTKGSVAGELRGSYTSAHWAQKAIDTFLNSKENANGQKDNAA